MKQMKKVSIYTDGGCLGNPGKGGYAAILEYSGRVKEISGGYRLTTNNRMEMTACIKALEMLKYPCRITLYSDSKYLVDGVSKGWAERWRSNGWKRNKKEMAEKYLPPIEEDVSTRRIFKVPINIFNTEIFLNNFLENAKHNFSSPTYIPQPIKTEQIRLEIEILEEPLFFDINF